MVTWSYSAISTFKQCPKKYYHLKVARDVVDAGSAATQYGQDVHKAAEENVKNGTPIPPQYSFINPVIESLKAIPGDKYCEKKLALKRVGFGYEPCGFFDNGVWWRGVADLLIIDGDKGFSVDYKTGKNTRYADTKQLDLIAGAIFVHYPEVKKIKSALAYVVSGELIRKDHNADDRNLYLSVFDPELERLEGAMASGVWNPCSGPLCGWCPVTQCEHNRRK